MRGSSNERFITCVDVSKYLKDLADRRGGYHCFVLAHDRDRSGLHRLSVVLERRDHVVLSKCSGHPKREWAYYPSPLYGSLAGCLYGLCHTLDNRLDDSERLAQDELPF